MAFSQSRQWLDQVDFIFVLDAGIKDSRANGAQEVLYAIRLCFPKRWRACVSSGALTVQEFFPRHVLDDVRLGSVTLGVDSVFFFCLFAPPWQVCEVQFGLS